MAFIPCKIGGGSGEVNAILGYEVYITGANTRAAGMLKLDTSNFSTLSIGSLTRGTGITIRSADIRDITNAIIYTINESNAEQTFDVSNYSEIWIYLDASGTVAWNGLIVSNIKLS